jgi:hypothetical protein
MKIMLVSFPSVEFLLVLGITQSYEEFSLFRTMKQANKQTKMIPMKKKSRKNCELPTSLVNVVSLPWTSVNDRIR